MRVLLLGTSGYHPTDHRQTACVLLPDLGIAFDAGTGMSRVARHLTTDRLDIFLSHAHLDHVVGLTYFFTLLHARSLQTITVHGEATKLTAIREHLFAPSLFPAAPPFEWRPLECGRPTVLPQGQLHCFPLIHPGGSIGFRLDAEGKSLAYVTDTTATVGAAYAAQIHGVDLLIHECNFPEGYRDLAEKTGHSCLHDVLHVAREAHVGRVMLTHFDPVLEISPEQLTAARRIFPHVELGADHLEIDL